MMAYRSWFRGVAMRRLSASASACVVLLAVWVPAWAGQSEQGEWLSYGRTANGQRFSPLRQIDAKSVASLGLAWSMDLPTSARTLEATPLEVNGVLYFTTSLSVVY